MVNALLAVTPLGILVFETRLSDLSICSSSGKARAVDLQQACWRSVVGSPCGTLPVVVVLSHVTGGTASLPARAWRTGVKLVELRIVQYATDQRTPGHTVKLTI